MSLLQKIKETHYRLQMRKAVQKSSIEELYIALEETRNEINRRNKKGLHK